MSTEQMRFVCSGCLHDQGRFVMRRGEEHTVVRCNRCTLAHILPRPQVDSTYQLPDLQYYEDNQVRYLRRGMDWHSIRLINMLRRYAPPPGQLLEIGCGTGVFLNKAHAAGYQVTGIEPSPG